MKNKVKRLITLCLAICLLLSCVACGGETSGSGDSQDSGSSSGEEVISDRDSLVYCVNFSEPGSYNSWRTGAALASIPVINAVMEPLMENDDGEWRYVLCTGYDMIDDLTVQVHLSDNVYFHNGEKMTSEDVVFSTQLSMDSVVGPVTWASVDSVEAGDEISVQYSLKYQSSGFNNALSQVSVTSKKYFDEVGHEGFAVHPIGTDYFMWDQYTPGDTVMLKSFDRYWGEHGTINSLQVRFIAETSQALIELESGNIDIMQADGSTLDVLEGNENFHVVTINDLIVEYLGFNLNSEKVQDERVRQAVAHAIDRESINDGARDGLCEVADSFMVPEHGAKYNPEAANYYEYDLDKARELMAEMGYSETNRLSLTLMTDTQTQRSLEAQQIKNMLEQVYFSIDVQLYEAAAFNDILSGGDPEWYDMLIRGVGVQQGEPLQQVYTILSCDATRTKTNPMWLIEESHPKAAEWNETILEALSTMDQEKQIPIVHELQILDREICQEVWLFNRISYFAVNGKLQLAAKGSNLNVAEAYFVE